MRNAGDLVFDVQFTVRELSFIVVITSRKPSCG